MQVGTSINNKYCKHLYANKPAKGQAQQWQFEMTNACRGGPCVAADGRTGGGSPRRLGLAGASQVFQGGAS